MKGDSESNVAEIWYFTRLQLERMSYEVQTEADRLRRAVVFRVGEHEVREGMDFESRGT